MESADRRSDAEFFVQGAYGNRTSRRALPPDAADGSADWRAAPLDCSSGQPARQCRAGADLFAGSDSLPRSAHGGDGGVHSAVLSLDVAQADVFHHRPVVRLSPLRALNIFAPEEQPKVAQRFSAGGSGRENPTPGGTAAG